MTPSLLLLGTFEKPEWPILPGQGTYAGLNFMNAVRKEGAEPCLLRRPGQRRLFRLPRSDWSHPLRVFLHCQAHGGPLVADSRSQGGVAGVWWW